MDSNNSENTDDINEMESLLYAQIHHEAVNDDKTPELGNLNTSKDVEVKSNDNQQSVETNIGTDCLTASQLLSKRYWNSAKVTLDCQQNQEFVHNTKYAFTRNPLKVDATQRNLHYSGNVDGSVDATVKSAEYVNQRNGKKSGSVAKIRPVSKRDLKPNPIAKWMERNKKDSMKVLNTANPSNVFNVPKLLKNGPFSRQIQKLEKHKQIKQKKEKSKKAQASATKVQVIDIVELDSNESDNSDVIMITVPPPPVITITESDDEKSKNSVQSKITKKGTGIALKDAQIHKTCSNFLKPRHVRAILPESTEKSFENSSRCTSACSIISSDDFIGQNDRRRLLTTSSGMADDEDLVLLTSDVDNLMQAQQEESTREKSQHNEVSKKQKQADSVPATLCNPIRRKINYRVDQNQFKALDVYESESDIADNIYVKGVAKPTVIREIVSSSESVEDISSIPKTKRLRKRRTWSSHKDLEIDSELDSTDDNEENDGGKNNFHNVPYIARGPAIERYKSRKRLSTNAEVSLSVKTSKFAYASGGTCDANFVSLLKNLSQDRDTLMNAEADQSDSSEGPTAREIAEKVLAKKKKASTSSVLMDSALPEKACEGLTEVFQTIDEYDKNRKSEEELDHYASAEPGLREGNRIVVTASDEDQIVDLIQEEENLVFTDVSHPMATQQKLIANDSPIYNITYSKDYNPAIGPGWNEEMRKFYHESWQGEKFFLRRILVRMNPDKSLWKIYTEDRFNKPLRRFRNLKCTNCCEFGHLRSKCKRPKKPMVCYMCGEGGHHEPRCPNTICLRCGNKTHVFTKSCNACTFQNRLTCPICNIRGHSIEFCPDKWRRYHSTTEPNVVPVYKNVQYNKRKYCCVCGARGHLSDSCNNAVRIMEYPVILSTIKSYQKSYLDYPTRCQYNGIGLNLMYEPNKDLYFQMAKNTDEEKYYGRFLNAVGMGCLLNRRIDIDLEKPLIEKNNIRNPCSKAIQQQAEKSAMDPPNQVQEVSESGSVEVVALADNSEVSIASAQDPDIVTNDDNDYDASPAVVFVEDEIAENIQLHVKGNDACVTDNCMSNVEDVESPGSNSNYSFSEHFQESSACKPVCNQTCDLQQPQPVKQNTKIREMKALPDFIPLFDINDINDISTYDKNNEAPTEDDCLQAGISRKFVMINSDEENAENRGKLPPNSPCEAKIYLTRFHSKYLLSPKGHEFLIKTSEECSVKARLDWTSVGHVLIIFGLPAAQDKFHAKLLDIFQKHFETLQLQKFKNVPKRTDGLIRFLRQNIRLLLTNLGSANSLLRRVETFEKRQTNNAYKLAEKARRSLNMILLGQAGLADGSNHLDKLLVSLKTLIDNHKAEDIAPSELRTEITEHWMPIFTPYRHSNYQEMVETYNKLISRNRLPKLNFDLQLLGVKVFNTKRTVGRKERINSSQLSTLNIQPALSNATNGKNVKRRQKPDDIKLPSSPFFKNSQIATPATISPTQVSSVKLASNDTKKSPQKQCKQMTPPPQANTNVNEASNTDFKNCCDTFLSNITSETKKRSGNAKLASVYWSRESLLFLNECIDVISGPAEILEGLQRVQTKAKNSQLSYADYLAVIKLRNSLIRK